ncbi:hypothetical protein [Tropicimonas sp. IMCC34043]|uniref:hypothetical protein n=1 Tax=Tropicimonas sp. IMCC34043 TaxID=2248760 RepID=UPI000E222DB2|nr:hypothetical protein [Tropicimonas sp. IMCC34043]
MSKFARNMKIDGLLEWDKANPGNAVRALFDRWCLPGHEPDDQRMLRLCVRNGYLSFYARGQSVAKLDCSESGVSAKIAVAYLKGVEKPPHGTGTLGSQTLSMEMLANPETAERVDIWTRTALTYAGAEKSFVDDLMSRHPNTIDLEMALPSHGSKMDLVIAQEGDGGLEIAFWEVKTAANGELRCSEGAAKVVSQVRKYQHWVNIDGNVEAVQAACRSTASILLRFYQHFIPAPEARPECVAIWERITDADPGILASPGVVIGDYFPQGAADMTKRRKIENAHKSFGPHRKKLEDLGITVHQVSSPNEAILPRLRAAEVTT